MHARVDPKMSLKRSGDERVNQSRWITDEALGQ